MTKDARTLVMGFAGLVTLMALTGILATLGQRDWLPDRVTGAAVILVSILIGCGYSVVRRSSPGSLGRALWIGIGAGGSVGAVLIVLALVQSIMDMSTIFVNFSYSLAGLLTPGFDVIAGMVLVLVLSLVAGAVGATLAYLPGRIVNPVIWAAILTIVTILPARDITLPIVFSDVVAATATFVIAYLVSRLVGGTNLWLCLLIGALNGLSVGVVAALLTAGTGVPGGSGGESIAVSGLMQAYSVPVAVLIFGWIGMCAGLIQFAPRREHLALRICASVWIALAVLELQPVPNEWTVLILFMVYFVALVTLQHDASMSGYSYDRLQHVQARSVRVGLYITAILVLIAAPSLAGPYLTNILNLVGLYIILGIGLSIVAGDAGLLDLGYAAFFAVGAYTVGLLTTPSLLTCAGASPRTLDPAAISQMCAGILSFWQALPIAIAISMLFGLLFGLPVLRLRGEYLALVTLGFGEITRIVLRADDFRDLFGAVQGIANVPRPVLDLSFLADGLSISFDRENGIYYLILAGIVAAIFVAARLKSSRVGRAWSAARADPDVAAAMGINLMRIRLLAVILGALFAGLAGAMSAIRFYGVYPDSFSLQVTLTVLTIVLVGGVGSIPAVIITALMLIGLPELLRELYDYRLLLFGLLLIVVTRMKSSSPRPTAGKRIPLL